MKPVFLCYDRCSTCQKARKWLDERGAAYDERPIREQNPTAEEIRAWRDKSGLPLKRFFNTSGMLYREMQLTDRLPRMSEEEAIALLASDGMLVRRPILVLDHTVLLGFREKEWQQALGGA